MNPTTIYRSVLGLFWLLSPVLGTALAQSGPADSNLLSPLGAPPQHLQDPFIFADTKKYFLFGTISPRQGFQCYESTNLVNWKLDGWAWRMSGLRVARGELRAPQVFLCQGMYCMVYSARTAAGTRFALAASAQPQGPYHDLHVPWLSFGEGCTSPSVFIDNNGKAYLTYSQRSGQNGNSTSIYGVALNQDLSKTIGSPAKLLTPDQRWESDGQSSKGGLLEAGRIFKIGSKYYMTYSANRPKSSDCAIGYATADKPLGPWEKSPDNPLLATQADAGISHPGEAAVFRALDHKEWFIVYQSSAAGSEERLVNIDRLVLEGIRQLAVKKSPRHSATDNSAAK